MLTKYRVELQKKKKVEIVLERGRLSPPGTYQWMDRFLDNDHIDPTITKSHCYRSPKPFEEVITLFQVYIYTYSKGIIKHLPF